MQWDKPGGKSSFREYLYTPVGCARTIWPYLLVYDSNRRNHNPPQPPHTTTSQPQPQPQRRRLWIWRSNKRPEQRRQSFGPSGMLYKYIFLLYWLMILLFLDTTNHHHHEDGDAYGYDGDETRPKRSFGPSEWLRYVFLIHFKLHTQPLPVYKRPRLFIYILLITKKQTMRTTKPRDEDLGPKLRN